MDIELLLEKKRFVYNPEEFYGANMDNYHFIIIGAGGTGGYLIPNLGRMVGIKNKEGKSHTVTIVDADLIEDKNLLRQNFSPNDVGKNKAEVMASRYGRAFGQTFYYLTDYIESGEQVFEIMQSESNKMPVIIDCVDNNKTRFIIKEGIRLYHQKDGRKNTAYVSSGNEEYAGQVIFSYQIANRFSSYSYEKRSPDLIDVFPNMEIDKLPTEESCAEQAVSAPQNIHTNMTAADIIFGFVNRLLNDKEVDTPAYFFDSQTMLRNSYSGRPTHIKQLLQLVEGNAAYNDFFPNSQSEENDVHAPSYAEVINSFSEEGLKEDLIEVNAEPIEVYEPQELERPEEDRWIPF